MNDSLKDLVEERYKKNAEAIKASQEVCGNCYDISIEQAFRFLRGAATGIESHKEMFAFRERALELLVLSEHLRKCLQESKTGFP